MNQVRRSDKPGKKKVITIVVIIAVVVAVLAILLNYAKDKITEKFGSSTESEIQSAEVTYGSISTTVTGTGTLENVDVEDYTIPSDVEIEEVYVSEGDTVAQGDLMASVNTSTVVSTMADLQTQLDELDDELDDASDDTVDSEITSSVSGRVKIIYGVVNDDVSTVMYDHGALMVLSLDGYMAVDVSTTDLDKGDQVSVETSDGTYTGSVESVDADSAVVLITDNGTTNGDTVTVSTTSGTVIGEGTLYVHQPLNVTGYAGTISKINVSENDSVDSGTTLFTLTDTSYTANYDTLLKQREDLEEELQNLVVIYKEGAVYAQMDGTVTGVTNASDDSSDTSSSGGSSSSGSSSAASSSSYGDMASMMTGAASADASSAGNSTDTSASKEDQDSVFSISPDEKMSVSVSVDESDINSVSEGQSALISISSIGDDTYDGTVTGIDKEGTSSSGVTTYTVTIEMDKTEQMLAGMSAEAVITIDGEDHVLLVPTDAVHQTSSTSYVYTSYDSENDEYGDMVEVTVGISNDSYTEITDGLSEGDTVYYEENEDENDFDFSGNGGTDLFGGGDSHSGGGDSHSGGGDTHSGGGDTHSGGGSSSGGGMSQGGPGGN